MEIQMENIIINKVHFTGSMILMWFPPPCAPKTTWQFTMVLTPVIPFLASSVVPRFRQVLRAAAVVSSWSSRQIRFKQQEVGGYLSGRHWVRILHVWILFFMTVSFPLCLFFFTCLKLLFISVERNMSHKILVLKITYGVFWVKTKKNHQQMCLSSI